MLHFVLLNDDQYLINNKIPKYELLYSMFIYRYTLGDGKIKSVKFVNPVYKEIVNLESFDTIKFLDDLSRSKKPYYFDTNYNYYGMSRGIVGDQRSLNWEILYQLFLYKLLKKTLPLYKDFYAHLKILSQDNYLEIIKILIKNEMVGSAVINEIITKQNNLFC